MATKSMALNKDKTSSHTGSKLWYKQPATQWEEALPLGNGRLGAMIYGGVHEEHLQMNEEGMWYGGKVDRNNPDMKEQLPVIRELIFKGEIKKAERLMKLAMSGCPNSMHPYQTLGNIYFRFEEGMDETVDASGSSDKGETEEVSCKNQNTAEKSIDGAISYYRELDLEEAVYRQQFWKGDTLFQREMFLSKPADVMVMRFTAQGSQKINFSAHLGRSKFFDGVKKIGKQAICLYGNLGKGGFDFSMVLLAESKDGSVSTMGEHLLVEDAGEVTLYFCADTTYHVGETELEDSILARIEKARKEGYENLYRAHVEDYRSLYGRVDFQLGDLSAYDAIPTDCRILTAGQQPADAGLSKLYFDYGRYLLISCSREDGLPATLQGLWNQDLLPPWDSKYTININTEMNYWPAENCNLSECHTPLFTLLKKMVPNGRRTAEGMYGAKGFMCHHNTDIHGDTATQDHWIPGSYWVLGAAWLCTHLWTHYQYTLDRDFLA